MKKVIIVLFLICFNSVINAQISKGTKMAGIAINYNQNKYENTYTSISVGSYDETKNLYQNLNMSVNGGYFVTNNIAVGLLAGYSNYNQEQEYSYVPGSGVEKQYQSAKSNIYSVGFYARAYKMLGEGKIGFFGNLDASYLFGNSERKTEITYNGVINENPVTDGEITGLNVGLRPGVVYFITKTIGLEASFGYLGFKGQKEMTESEGEAQSTYESSGFNFNFSASTFNLGLNFYFSSKTH